MRKSNKEVLIIEDDPSLLLLYEKIVQEAGFKTLLAADGEEGIELFIRHYPELVITDIIMPRKEGIETIRELKEYDPGLKIIAISGGGEIDAQSHLKIAHLLGADIIMKKPIDIMTLANTLWILSDEVDKKAYKNGSTSK